MTASDVSEKLSQEQLDDLVLESDSGGRKPSNKYVAFAMVFLTFTWSLFQIFLESPQHYDFIEWLNDTWLADHIEFIPIDKSRGRLIHLAFALSLCFMAYPALKSSPRKHIPILDWVFGIIAVYCALYGLINYEVIANRSGDLMNLDIIVACVGIAILLEACRRSLGMPLVIIASILLCYAFFGNGWLIPDMINIEGKSLRTMASHMWITSEGVFGVPLGASASYVFLFVLFGSLLDKAGAGNYFIKLAFALLGHMRGGPAKAAVLSSGMTGVISGSSIANTVTTGTFTIPLMKRVGFSGAKAGAVEVASSVNGQIMPPVMGAAAFIMNEYLPDLSYKQLMIHAFLPAFVSYVALIYMVHLEALKSGMQGLPKRVSRRWYQSALLLLINIVSIVLLWIAIGYIVDLIREYIVPMINNLNLPIFEKTFLNPATLIFITLLFVAYVVLLYFACKVDDLEIDDPNSPVIELPILGKTAIAGMHFVLPIFLLVWLLMVEEKTAGFCAYYASLMLVLILLTQNPIKAFFRKTGDYKKQFKIGVSEFVDGMTSGARNMIGIAIATATAGLVVGVVTLTSVGLAMAELIEAAAGDSIILILILTAIVCLILGMGLPTVANYTVVASLMVVVIQTLGEKNGLIVPLVAIHLFVFYFGIMADVTPPVGLASFAAAAISGADPIRTGIQAFVYSLRTAILPFCFIFNNELIMVGVTTLWHGALVFLYAIIGVMIFSSAVQGYFFAKNRIYESVILLIASIIILVPQFPNNQIFMPYQEFDPINLSSEILEIPEDGKMRISGIELDDIDDERKFKRYYTIKDANNAADILKEYGLKLDEAGKIIDITFASPAEDDMIAAKSNELISITKIELPKSQPSYRLMYIPAAGLILLVAFLQIMRNRRGRKSDIGQVAHV